MSCSFTTDRFPPASDRSKYKVTQSNNVWRVRELWTYSPKCDVFIKSLPPGLMKLWERGSRKRQRGWRTQKKQGLWAQQEWLYIWNHRTCSSVQRTQICASWGSSAEKSVHKPPSLTMISPLYSHLQIKNCLF